MQMFNPSTHVLMQIDVCCIPYERGETVFERKQERKVILKNQEEG